MARKPPELSRALAFGLLLFGGTGEIQASDVRVGFGLGLGGIGLTRSVTASFGTTNVSRSEGPGVFSLFVDLPLSDSVSVAVEHTRGFRLGPFSSGLSLTGASGRWYFRGALPALSANPPTGSSLVLRAFQPFVGFAAGVATGSASREGEIVETISDSGVYLGYRMGADYPLNHRAALRPELSYSTTIAGTGKIVEFAFQCGILFAL